MEPSPHRNPAIPCIQSR
ncbi:TPA: hypothetical protein N0F65_000965 [Lagenidium giganteum]|uniref:Uncharacterized protein n=1 Tax=Lagenidium giganteum TaxID=4803 RepID=A0AAV2YZR7_9STRA|nr:TPA: hypothetical protein N0F65_000965 [Lagenidium giganteum]